MPSSIRSKRKPNRQKLTIAITDIHSSTNQPSVANHDQETLLREHNFSYMFACTGSFQQPSVRHAMPITRSTRFLTEAGRPGASLIFLACLDRSFLLAGRAHTLLFATLDPVRDLLCMQQNQQGHRPAANCAAKSVQKVLPPI